MKKTNLGMMMAAALLATSCLSEQHDLAPETQNEAQTGEFVLDLNADASFNEQTRALSEANYRNTDNYTVQIINTLNNQAVLECTGAELADNLPKTLELGSYEAVAFYGNEHDASRSEFRVEGSTTFTIKAKDKATVTINCAPTCGKVSAEFAGDMDTYFDDYSVTYGGTAKLGTKTFKWAKGDNEPWYVALGTSEETLTFTVDMKVKDEYAVEENGVKKTTATATGSFKLQRNRAHKLTITPSYTPTTEGGVKITITIDESVNERPYVIDVPVTWI